MKTNVSSSRGTSQYQHLNPNLVHRIIKRTDMPLMVKARLAAVLPVFFIMLSLVQKGVGVLLPERLVVFPYYTEDAVLPLSQNSCSAIVCLLFFLLTLHQIANYSEYRRHPQKHEIFLRFMLVMFLVFSSYIVAIFGHSTGVLGAHERVISLPRIVQWALSTPILVSMTVRLSPDGKSWKPFVMTTCAVLVQIFGWIGTLLGNYGIIVVSWVFFVPVIHYMNYYMSRAAQRLAQEKKFTAKVATAAIFAAWTVFPVLWWLDWLHAASALTVEQLTAAMDFVSKMIMIYVLGSNYVFPFELGEEVEYALDEYATVKKPINPSFSRLSSVPSSRGSPLLEGMARSGPDATFPSALKENSGPLAKNRSVSRVSEVSETGEEELEVGAEARDLSKPRVSVMVCENAAMMFSDITNFTSLCHELPIIDVINMLSELFCEFDTILAEYNGTKIKTIGDGYMAAFLNGTATENTHNAVRFSERAIATAATHLGCYDRTIRVGIHTGEVTYGSMDPLADTLDVWGSTVNVASRMESMGVAGRIHISRASRDAVEQLYVLEDRPSPLAVKGVGEMSTSFVLHPRKSE